MTHTGFFAVGRDTFVAACGQGVNAAAAFLVLARGSGGDNVTTKWSAGAAATRLGTRWTTADAAVKQLAQARLVTRMKGSTRPVYKLANRGDPIWLPNAVVDGAAAEVPPIARLRQAQDAMALRLLVELYSAQNLREDGGVSPSVIWQTHERERVGQRGAYAVWRFDQPTPTASGTSDVTTPHYARLTAEEQRQGKNRAEDFFRRLGYLESLGLIEWVPYLFEGPAGEPIHPLHEDAELEPEATLYRACSDAAARCLIEGQHDRALSKGGVLAPVPAHIEQVRLIGVARLRYRPRTAMTAAWWGDHVERCREYAERYAGVAGGAYSGTGAVDAA